MSLSTDDESSISKYVGEVGITVHRICQRTMNVMTDAHNPALERHAGPIVANLEECRGELEYYGGGGSTNGIGGGDGTLISNTAREKIPPISFKVARVTKVCMRKRKELSQIYGLRSANYWFMNCFRNSLL